MKKITLTPLCYNSLKTTRTLTLIRDMPYTIAHHEGEYVIVQGKNSSGADEPHHLRIAFIEYIALDGMINDVIKRYRIVLRDCHLIDEL